MPTYEYACTECGDRTEVVRSFSDEPPTTCTVCGGPLRKVFSPVGIVFKGSGFYRTDSRGRPSTPKTDGGGDKDKAKKPAETTSKASSDGGGSTSTPKAAEKSA
jgi:putative FmdB family regulatory protein